MPAHLTIRPTGGTTFSAALHRGDDREFLGLVECGEIDRDGQWVGEDAEVIALVREVFGVAGDVPAAVVG